MKPTADDGDWDYLPTDIVYGEPEQDFGWWWLNDWGRDSE